MPPPYMPSLLQQYAYKSYLSALQRHYDKFGKPFDLPIKSFVSPCNFCLFYSMLKCLRMVNGGTSIEMCMEEPPNKDGDTLQIQEVFSDKFLTL